MEAAVKKDGDVLIVYLQGYLDFVTIDPFRKTCLTDFADKKVIFNMKDLSFVGSSGITTFIQAMEELKAKNIKGMKFCAVGVEFKRVFSTSDVSDVEIFETENQARIAFQTQPTILEAADILQPPGETLADQIKSAEFFRKQST